MTGEDVLIIEGPNLEMSSIILAAALAIFVLFCIMISVIMENRKKKKRILKEMKAMNPFSAEDEARDLWKDL